MTDAFAREEILIGRDAMNTLQSCHVKVFGIGGVGSYAAEALARAGIGTITLIDEDTVSESNLNRQLCALHSTIGRYKSDVMRDRVLDINPCCNAISLPYRYDEAHADSFFDVNCDFIIDAIDLVSCKLSLIEQAKRRNIPIISCLGTGNKFDPTKFQITDISKTINCPLSRVMRKELRNRGILHHTVLFSEELPSEATQSGENPPPGRRSVPGSLSWVPSVAGLMLAGYTVTTLCAKSSPSIEEHLQKLDFFKGHK